MNSNFNDNKHERYSQIWDQQLILRKIVSALPYAVFLLDCEGKISFLIREPKKLSAIQKMIS